MAFGLYLHIPYCMQICPYCDFTKYRLGSIMPPESYVERVKLEIRSRAVDIVPRLRLSENTDRVAPTSLYFGGGTPSLIEPSLILALIEELANVGLVLNSQTEVTLEIDPRTVDERKLDRYLEMGINRFSVGAQSFHPHLLRIAGRQHEVGDTQELLRLLARRQVSFTLDVLFALPTETVAEVREDARQALDFGPQHISTYCLTVGEQHPLAKNRAPDEEQVEMFQVLDEVLSTGGLRQYEISNYARPGFESRHNLLYWTDQSYWGIGVGAHSYLHAEHAPEYAWGVRFWNAPSLPLYDRELGGPSPSPWRLDSSLPERNIEKLMQHQALTDFCHTSLRMRQGLREAALRRKFGDAIMPHMQAPLERLQKRGLLQASAGGWQMTPAGIPLANQVFTELTFLQNDL